ncbi:alpha/beta hydrolase [Pseudothauera nasutitermitis]|nr:alpha/beta hydrolase-fold protein [Pseudothauera nasutitermitis]
MSPVDLLKRRGVLLGLSALALPRPLRAQTAAGAAESAESVESARPRRASQTPAETIVDERVESFTLNSSAHSGEPWRIHLARPRGAAPAAGYRALYLLDGNASFPLAWHALAALRAARPALAEALDRLALVGIGYPSGLRIDTPRRYHDFTPYTAEEFRRARGVDLATGGRQVFLDFLARDVREAIARRLPIDPQQQTLFGHSLGGLFTLHVLYNRPELFQHYVATDPSFWWNGSSVLQEQAAFVAGARAAGGKLASPLRLLVENAGADAERAARPTPAASLAGLDGLRVWHRIVAGETHGSLIGPAAADAVLFAVDQVPEGAQRL